MFAKVVIDMKNDHIDDSYDYLIPDNLEDFIKVGTRVLVSFGYQDLLGYVIEITSESKFSSNIKPIKAVLDFEQELTPEQVDLAKYLSETYHVNMPNVLELMIPSFLKGQKRSYLVVKDYDKLHPILHMLFEGKSRVFIDNKIISNYSLVKKEIASGNITLDYDLYTYGKNKKQKVYTVSKGAIFKNDKRNQIINYVLEHPEVTEEMIYSYVDCSNYLIKQMVKEGYLSCKEITIFDDYDGPKTINKNYVFTFDQTQTIERLKQGRQNKYLLFSNDEEFKANLYLEIIEENIKKHLPTIFIAPTIFMAEELLMFLRKKLDGYNIVSLNSKNTKNENYETFMNVKYNKFDVLVSTISGIFLPFKTIGTMVVIDEDNNYYLNENYPYYDAIDVCSFRSKYHNSKLILTSSSPSIENYFKSEYGEYNLLTSGSKKVGHVEIVDMKNSIMRGSSTIISNTLYNKMKEVLDENKKVILYINNKSYSSVIKCRECGHILKCPKCSIPLTLYKEKQIAKCNYCDYKVENYNICNKCSSTNMISFGFGIEKVKEVINELFPNKTIIQIDSDVLKSIDEYEKAILQIEEGTADIIIGTNILSKYVNNSNIGLTAILSADRLLNSNDYRANEYTYNSIARLISNENLIIQTYYPNNNVIRSASIGDYDSYYEKEIEKRKELKYFPYCDVNRITITGDFKTIYYFANYFKKVFTRIIDGDVLGPVYDSKIKGIKIILKHNDYEKVIKIYKDTKIAFKDKDVQTSFERKPKVI